MNSLRRSAGASLSGLRAFIFHPVFLTVLLLGAATAGVRLYQKYQDAQAQVALLKNPEEAARVENQKIVDAVGKLIALPEGETPTIATVTDKERLQDQQFFSKAEIGDKVLIYTQAKKAILYRPSTNKVIEVGQVNIGQ